MPPEASLAANAPVDANGEGFRGRGFQGGFFDPFAAELSAEAAAGYPPHDMIAATSAPSGVTNVSVYGVPSGPVSTGLDYDGAENLMQVSFTTEGADFDPDVSGDGRFVVYASTQHHPTANIYIKRTDSRAVTQITADPGNDVMPRFSPDAARVAFASDRGGNWDIYLVNSNGGQAVQVTDDPAPELHPSWSPDGSMLCYCRLGTTSQKWELWVVEAVNPAIKRFIGYGLFPDWNPASNRIVYQRSRGRGDRLFSVWTIDFVNGEGVNPTEIVSSPFAAAVNPTWSPDGQRIAFATIPLPAPVYGQRPAGADLWIISPDGSGRANLTGGRHVNLMPTWAGDNRIYFVSDRSGADNIWSVIPEKAIQAAMGPIPPSETRAGAATSNRSMSVDHQMPGQSSSASANEDDH